jgi:hypothetical protein
VNGRWRGGAIDPSLDRRTSFRGVESVADGLESPASIEELLDAENGVVVVEGVEEGSLRKGETLITSWTSRHMYILAEDETL